MFNYLFLTRVCSHRQFSPLFLSLRRINQSYYDILKVSQTCTSREIRDAFILLSKKHHPDKHLNDPSTHEKFVQINEAYSTLINPSKRRAYDLSLYHKRKLNAPFENSYADHRSSAYSDSFHKSSRSNFYEQKNAHYNHYKNPFGWNEQTRSQKSGGYTTTKRYSNATVVTALVIFTVVGAIVQMLAIRKSFHSTHEKMVERSREYGLIHSMAQDRAHLYGNERQIEILRNGAVDDSDKLHVTQPNPQIQEPTPPPTTTSRGNTDSEEFTPLGSGGSDLIKNNVVKNKEKCQLHENTDPNSLYCPKHKKNFNLPPNEKNEIENNVLPPPKVCKKCNKRVNK